MLEIILIRHGKPTQAINPRLSSKGFENWVNNYNLSNIAKDSLPPQALRNSLVANFIIASDLPRSIHSANLCVGKAPDLSLPQLREMDIPSHYLPFKLNVNTWLFINRFLWLLGFSKQVESFTLAKKRAINSAIKLHDLANKHRKVAVFGHGLMNQYIAKELTKLGWNINVPASKKYWGATTLTFKDKKH